MADMPIPSRKLQSRRSVRVRRARPPAPAWLGVAFLAACDPAPPDRSAPGGDEPVPVPMETRATGSEWDSHLGDFLADYWRLPVPLQGDPPPDFSQVDASLDPTTCGACHPKQHAEWKTSFHAAAFSPGLLGQLIEGSLAAPQQTRACYSCHAPLGEQQRYGADLRPNPHYDESLRDQGVLCAGCHVRAHRRYGPPRRADAPSLPDELPHGGFEARPEFQESRFCAACHQFFDDPGVNGKPLENTYFEWLESPHADAGETCQSCHMPDRAHLWRGIHDPEMVRNAVDVELVPFDLAGDTLQATLVLRSRGVGHAFPTYVTPRVTVALWQEDESGEELPDTRIEAVIGREIDFGSDPWREVFDTRVAPGESVRLDYVKTRRSEARQLVGRVTVDPDFHYRGVFATLLTTLQDPEARALIEEAVRRVSESRYVLSETRRPLPRGPG